MLTSVVTDAPLWGRLLIKEEAICVWGQGIYGKNLYTLNFAVNLKCSKNNNILILKRETANQCNFCEYNFCFGVNYMKSYMLIYLLKNWSKRNFNLFYSSALLTFFQYFLLLNRKKNLGFPCGSSGKKKKKNKQPCQCWRLKRYQFDPRVGKIPWRRKWQPIPVFLPEECHGQRSLAGYSPWSHPKGTKL